MWNQTKIDTYAQKKFICLKIKQLISLTNSVYKIVVFSIVFWIVVWCGFGIVLAPKADRGCVCVCVCLDADIQYTTFVKQFLYIVLIKSIKKQWPTYLSLYILEYYILYYKLYIAL